MKPYIITIARQYGSGGKTVGKMLADKLHIPFYNREIITMASEDSGINEMLFSDERLKPRPAHAPQSALQGPSAAAERLVQGLSAGRRAVRLPGEDHPPPGGPGPVRADRPLARDYILKGPPRTWCAYSCMRMRISAWSRPCWSTSLPEEEVVRKIAEIDDYRAKYYKHHTGSDWYDARNYDLSLNSGVLGF